jgi:hypothetical protein
MAELDKPILSDPAIIPDELLLKTLLGDKMEWWNQIMEHTMQHYPSVSPVWRYYNDGKQWLFRLLQKKDTIFWTSLVGNTFRITFYFTDKFEPFILGSHISEEVKTGFLTSKHYGKIRGITIRMESTQDIEAVKELIAIKLQIK